MHHIQKHIDQMYKTSGYHRGRPPYVIGVDLDGCLAIEECWTPEQCLNATPNLELIQLLRDKFPGCLIIIWTARVDELIPASLKWLRKHDVPFRAISNLKMGADLYIDDKTLNPRDVYDWLPGWRSEDQPKLFDD